ncbi:Putative NmrA-like domain, NAD(P)-binding domain superfamily [Colletotrichum destructivum]|uniref:NmrA-like domain, NAD(P)-binding domain superfamily n=1 Tax=Colletotrichum destructivum TaxID=34406 RepID=A0AAX4IV31_9PEZI|nr:Putative NmrA-like domain, NAD(P)-binding domain superfamily [Colletotrichum destructivum]
MKSIGIFPGSGALGGCTYDYLLKLLPADQIILINRHPEKVPQEHIKNGVRARKASYESSPSDLQAVFSGIEVLFLISYPSHVHDYRKKVQLPAIDAARRAGVKHIFYSSLAFAGDLEDSSVAEVMQAHLDSERYLAEAAASDPSFTYTSVREGLYSESYPIYTAFFDITAPAPHTTTTTTKTDEILIPHDGSGPGVAWVKRAELAEATAKLISQYSWDPDQFPHVNDKVLLTGPRVWSLAETVEVLGRAAGRDVRIRRVDVDEYVKLPQVLARFGSREKARTWATAWEAIAKGETAVVTDTLREVIGRHPEEFDVTIKRLGQARDA